MLNSIVIMGRLVRDPEYKKTNNNVEYCSFTIAVERDMAKGKTDFIPCTAWRGTAAFVNSYFTKGSMICVEGRLENNPYEGRDGKKRDSWQVNVSSVHFCGSRAESSEPKAVNVEWEELPDEGELPF